MDEIKITDMLIGNYSDAIDEREEWKYRVNSIILMSSSTIFSIVISISIAFAPMALGYLLCLSFLLNGLCVLSCVLLLFGQLGLKKRSVKACHQEISKAKQYLSEINNGGHVAPISVKNYKFYNGVAIFSYVCYGLMIVSYVTFVIIRYLG